MKVHGVTIGIPVYNERRHIEQAVRSAAPQCETLLVSDNASTDGSAEICERLCREYQNLRLVRQASNLGALDNFKFLLDQASTPRFMWLGAHDFIPEGYVETLSQALDASPDAALAFGMTRNVSNEGTEIGWYRFDYHARIAGPSPLARLDGMICCLRNCSLLHGLFRTDLLRKSWEHGNFLGFDRVLLARAAMQGRLIYVPATHLCRRIVRDDDTWQKRMVRVSGVDTGGKPVRHMMQFRLESLMRDATVHAGWRGYWLRLKIRVVLIGKYGPYGATAPARVLAAVVHPFTRAARAVNRQFRRLGRSPEGD